MLRRKLGLTKFFNRAQSVDEYFELCLAKFKVPAERPDFLLS